MNCSGDGQGTTGVCQCGIPRAVHAALDILSHDPASFNLNSGSLSPKHLEEVLKMLNAHGRVTIFNGAIGQQMSLMELGAFLAHASLEGKL